jgi:proliferating cell nuclear antigen
VAVSSLVLGHAFDVTLLLCCHSAHPTSNVYSIAYCRYSDTDRVAEYDMKLMDIDQDTLGIPDTLYDSKVYMPSQEFARICRELASLGESVRIEVTKEGIRFASEGDIANGSVLLKPTEGAGRYTKKNGTSSDIKGEPAVKKEKTDDDEEMEEDDGGAIEEAEQDEEGEQPAPKKKKKAVVVDDDEEEAVPEAEPEEEEEEDSSSKKRKRKSAEGGSASKKAKRGKKTAGSDGEEEDSNSVSISVTQAVSLSFSLKYLINFAKAAGLTSHVELMMSADVPLLVSKVPLPSVALELDHLLLRFSACSSSNKDPSNTIWRRRLGTTSLGVLPIYS